MDLDTLFSIPVPIKSFSKKFLADMDTPVSSFYNLAHEPDSFMLESMQGTGYHARYSVIGRNPLLIFKHQHQQTTIKQPATNQTLYLKEGNPYDHLKKLLNQVRFERKALFQTGFLCGYLAYDAIRYIEKIPANAFSDVEVPEILLILPGEVIIFDNLTHTLHLIVHLEDNRNETDLEKIAAQQLEAICQKFYQQKFGIKEFKRRSETPQFEVVENCNLSEFVKVVSSAKEYIRHGDIFQVVLSRRLQMRITSHPFEIYRMLRLINPSPYMFYLNFHELKLVGSSPETMVKFDGKRVTVRPIAGTRKRGASPEADREIAAELLRDEKELAEHEMLVDLGRNDVGRIARYGTVRLDTYKQVENYSHVMHIVSNVSGELYEEFDIVDIFKACFPAGTVSGAPKVRAMEIIDELEKTARGPYAGAVGYFDFNGRMDTCIAIRTLLIKAQMAYWQAGAGIVADSIPENEYHETENKARALLKAIEFAEEVQNDCHD